MDAKWILGGALVLSFAAFGCGDGIDLPKPAQMEKVGTGDGQRATAGNRLARPLSVHVTAADGSDVPRERISWDIIEGQGAALSDSVTVTDGSGVAHAYLTLGPTPGTYGVRASVERKSDVAVTFAAQAVEAPVLTEVDPTSFAGGDAIVLRGTGFSDSVAVFIGGKPAVIDNVAVTGLGMTVFAPPCVVPGPVTVEARVGTARSEVMATYTGSASVLTLARGDYVSVEPSALGDCATFPTAGPSGAEYLLAAQLVGGRTGDSLAFRLETDSATTVLYLRQPPPAERSPADRFHDFLRSQERELAQRPRAPYEAEPSFLTSVNLDIQVGDLRSFRVCDKITCSTVDDFAPVNGTVKYVGDHAVIYQDVDVPSGGLADADFQELGELFDSELYPLATSHFGAESDLDRNGRVLILMTPVVNGLTDKADCSEAFVTGFFYPLDVDPGAAKDQRSNQAEIFYAMVPDPSGSVTCSHTVDRVKRLVPVTFVHEFQHMISFYQHVVLRAGDTEVTWLNEGMSHVSEELAGLYFEALGDQARFSAFAIGDLLDAFKYLSNPSAEFLLYVQGTGTLEERGAAWLFLRWLIDQQGEDVVRRLSETGLTGVDNVTHATGEEMSALLSDWFLSNFVAGDSTFRNAVPDQLRLETWNLQRVYASLNQQDPSLFPRPYPLVPQTFTGGVFSVSGMLRSGSGAYFRVIRNPNEPGFSVRLVDGGGAPLSGPSGPRLQVLRVR